VLCVLLLSLSFYEVFQNASERNHGTLTQVALAMLNYEAEHGRLPPAVVYGEDGKPLHSWRVLILPYLDEEALYKDFRLDEPWDSPHNIQLLPRMPQVYAAPGRKARKMPPYHTVVHVFVSKGTAFEGREGLKTATDFPDGRSNTILLVEAGKPVPWTKPEELPYAADQPLPDLQPIFKGGFRVALVDGLTLWIGEEMPERTFREAIVRNEGLGLHQDW
jgi:hypothetical protein